MQPLLAEPVIRTIHPRDKLCLARRLLEEVLRSLPRSSNTCRRFNKRGPHDPVAHLRYLVENGIVACQIAHDQCASLCAACRGTGEAPHVGGCTYCNGTGLREVA